MGRLDATKNMKIPFALLSRPALSFARESSPRQVVRNTAHTRSSIERGGFANKVVS